MPKVTIDGIEYVPKSEVLQINDKKLMDCLVSLTAMRCNPHECMSFAIELLSEFAPELAKLSSKNPRAAYDVARSKRYENDEEPYLESVEQLARDLTKGEQQ